MPRLARLYFTLLTLASIGLLAWWLARWADWPPASPWLAAVLLLLAVAAQQFPLEVAPGYKITASSAAYVAALLALGPPAAVALIGAAQLLGGLGLFLRRDAATGRRRRGLAGVLFNAAQLVLAFGLGGLALATALPSPSANPLGTPAAYLATMAGLQRGRSPWATWLAGQREELPEALALFPLGLALALLAGAGSVGPALLAPPLALLHWALARAHRLRGEAAVAAAELRAALEAIEQGVLLVGPNERVRYANRRLGTFFGVDSDGLPGRNWADVLAAEIGPRLREQRGKGPGGRSVTAAIATVPERGEFDVIGDEVRTLAYYRGPVRTVAGALVGRVEVYEDVTAARRLARAREEFLMVASHELNTPLTTLGGYLELLARDVDRSKASAQAQMVRHVAIASQELGRLRRLCADLVAAAQARAEGLAVVPRPLDLARLVRDAVERFAIPRNLAARGHRITCRAVGPLWGQFDAARMEQVLGNLLGNALKYSPKGGEVAVVAWQIGNEARVSVRDHGIGVADEEREKLFTPFYRAQNAGQGSPEGLGLGLAISRDIVEAHGGRLWVEAAPVGGSIFHMSLPLTDRSASGTQPDCPTERRLVAVDGTHASGQRSGSGS
jgi:signal transduction histidine kinase